RPDTGAWPHRKARSASGASRRHRESSPPGSWTRPWAGWKPGPGPKGRANAASGSLLLCSCSNSSKARARLSGKEKHENRERKLPEPAEESSRFRNFFFTKTRAVRRLPDMKNALVILSIVSLGLAVGLLIQHNQGSQALETAEENSASFCNSWQQARVRA